MKKKWWIFLLNEKKRHINFSWKFILYNQLCFNFKLYWCYLLSVTKSRQKKQYIYKQRPSIRHKSDISVLTSSISYIIPSYHQSRSSSEIRYNWMDLSLRLFTTVLMAVMLLMAGGELRYYLSVFLVSLNKIVTIITLVY